MASKTPPNAVNCCECVLDSGDWRSFVRIAGAVQPRAAVRARSDVAAAGTKRAFPLTRGRDTPMRIKAWVK